MAMQKHHLLRLALISLMLFVCVGCDQAAKAFAKQTLFSSPPVSFLRGIVQFQYAENPGAFLSLGADLPAGTRFLWGVVFIGLTQVALLVYLLRSTSLSLTQKAGLSLFLGGGVGNLIDRIANDGHVIDFVSLGVGSLRTGIFNVADVAITAGVLIVLFAREAQVDVEPNSDLRRAVEEAERDIAEGRWVEHSEVVKKLKRWVRPVGAKFE